MVVRITPTGPVFTQPLQYRPARVCSQGTADFSRGHGNDSINKPGITVSSPDPSYAYYCIGIQNNNRQSEDQGRGRGVRDRINMPWHCIKKATWLQLTLCDSSIDIWDNS